MWYHGNSLDTYPQGFGAYTHNFEYYELRVLNYLSGDANFYIYISQDTEMLEISLVNQGLSTIEITNLRVISIGESCPY